MASTQANTWPPLIGPGSWDNEKQRQLYGNEVYASVKITDVTEDEFFHPVNRSLTGYSFEGILYQNGAEVPSAPRASWYLEGAGRFRGQDAAFPRQGMVLATDAGLSVLNNETGRYILWMMALRRDDGAFTHNFLQDIHGATPDHLSYKNGRIVVRLYPDAGSKFQMPAFLVFDFVQDQIYLECSKYKIPILTAYTTSPAHYTVNTPITPNVCILAGDSGNANKWTILPELPAGLTLDEGAGTIAGTPTVVTPPEVYTITAENKAGVGQCILILDVKDPLVTLTPTRVMASTNQIYVLMSDGSLWVAGGLDSLKELFPGTPPSSALVLKRTNLTGVVDVRCGYDHYLALKADGTVWTWGNNYFGQLGNGDTAGAYDATPTQVLTDCVAIAALIQGSVALKADGTVWTWGACSGLSSPAANTDNPYGNSCAPQNWNGLTGITAIAAGWGHWLALKSDGSVWGYGVCSYWELGINSAFSVPHNKVMIQVLGPGGAKAIAAGQYTSYFVTPAGAALGCGRHDLRQMGSASTTGMAGNTPCVKTPAGLGDGLATGVEQIVSGRNWALALKDDGTTYSWGSMAGGGAALGITVAYTNTIPGVETTTQVPTRTLYPLASQVSASDTVSAALLEDGTIMTCGTNSFGGLGDGVTSATTSPVHMMLP